MIIVRTFALGERLDLANKLRRPTGRDTFYLSLADREDPPSIGLHR